MQLKLLNYYKLLSSFASSLVGSFISLIIYKATGSLLLAFLYIVGHNAFTIIFGLIFRKLVMKCPQIFLVLKVIPLTGLYLSLLIVPHNMWLGVSMCAIFNGFAAMAGNIGEEAIFSYANKNMSNSSSKLSTFNIFNKCGLITSQLLGGLVLQKLPTYICLIMAIALTFIATTPLLIFYFKNRKNPGFNKDLISNAAIELEKQGKPSSAISKQILSRYSVVLGLTNFINVFLHGYNLYLFIKLDMYYIAGIIAAVINLGGMIGLICYKLIDKRFDSTIFASIFSIMGGVSIIAIQFLSSIYAIVPLMAVTGFAFSLIYIFVRGRMLSKLKLVGGGNDSAFWKESATCSVRIIYAGVGMSGIFLAFFSIMGAGLFLSAWMIPHNEEKTRKLMIDYINQNEISS